MRRLPTSAKPVLSTMQISDHFRREIFRTPLKILNKFDKIADSITFVQGQSNTFQELGLSVYVLRLCFWNGIVRASCSSFLQQLMLNVLLLALQISSPNKINQTFSFISRIFVYQNIFLPLCLLISCTLLSNLQSFICLLELLPHLQVPREWEGRQTLNDLLSAIFFPYSTSKKKIAHFVNKLKVCSPIKMRLSKIQYIGLNPRMYEVCTTVFLSAFFPLLGKIVKGIQPLSLQIRDLRLTSDKIRCIPLLFTFILKLISRFLLFIYSKLHLFL